jgi:hypothetical protein
MDPAMTMAVISAISSIVGGLTGEKGKTSSTFNKGQLKGLDEVLNSIKSGIGGPNQDITQSQPYQQGNEFFNSLFNDPEFFNRFEAPAFRQFEEDIAPGLANRYASMGSGGSTGSTGFRNQLAREGGNLATNLAAQRGQMQQQAVPQMLGYAQQPVSNWMTQLQTALQPTQNVYQPPSQGFMGGLAAPFAQGSAYLYGNQAGQNQANPGGGGGFQNPASMQRGYPGQYPGTY